MTCDDVRELLLDHLYGALDADETAAVETHLASCDACRGELAAARSQKELLAIAAQMELPDVSLAPPVKRPLWRRTWVRAAAVILVGLSLGAFGYRARARSVAVREHPVLRMVSPSLVAETDVTPLQFAVMDVDGDPRPGSVTVRVGKAYGDVVFEKTLATDARGIASVDLPAGLARAGTDLFVQARMVGGCQGGALTQRLQVSGALLTRITTDKPLYRPGDAVRVRVLTLDRLKLTPAGHVTVHVKLRDAHGNVLAESDLRSLDGVAAWTGALGTEAAGGTYTLVVEHPLHLFPRTEQTFQVRAYRAPRLTFVTDLDRDSYAPGDSGTLALEVARAAGGTPSEGTVDAALSVDGDEISREHYDLPADGKLSVPFRLPPNIDQGRASLALVATDGGDVDAHVVRVPVTLDRLDVTLFPESGDLVAGLPTRVYFKAEDPAGKPAHVEAELVDDTGEVVARGATEFAGMGVFALTPQVGRTYSLRAVEPSHITLRGDVPTVHADGVALTSKSDVQPAGAPVRVTVASTRSGPHTVTASIRGFEVARTKVALLPGRAADVDLTPITDVGGTVRVTVSDPDGNPRAERLFARAALHRVNVEITTDRPVYAPGDRVEAGVQATDENGRPVQTVLGVTVADLAVRRLADDRDTANLPVHFLLGESVERLEEAALFTEGPQVAHATDLLLGVQGWRRFVWTDLATWTKDRPERVARLEPVVPQVESLEADIAEKSRQGVRRAVRHADERIGQAVGVAVAGLLFLIPLLMAVTGIRGGHKLRATIGVSALGLYVVLIAAMPFAARNVMETAAMAPGAAMDVGAERWLGEGEIAVEDKLDVEHVLEGLTSGDDVPELAQVDAGDAARLAGRVRQGDGRFIRREGPITFDRGPPLSDTRGFDFTHRGLNDAGPGAGEPGFAAGGGGSGDRSSWYRERAYPEYAHEHTSDGARSDFTDVLYWIPYLRTDAQGRATFAFDTSDRLSTFELTADASDERGALSTNVAMLVNRLPFSLSPKVPAELTEGDALSLPIAVANGTASAMDVTVSLAVDGAAGERTGDPQRRLSIVADGRGRALYDVTAAAPGTFTLSAEGRGPGGLTDRTLRDVHVARRGYPMEISAGGRVGRDADTLALLMPQQFDRSSLDGAVRLFPSALSALVEGLDGLLREPTGCFEQTSSSNHPNVLVLRYLEKNGLAEPALARRARDLVAQGYDRLRGFECPGGGFDLYGNDPGDAALTAYGLMQFADIAEVHDVDPELLQRVRDWILARRDGRGGFVRPERNWGPTAEVFDAYTVWALTEADARADVAKELATTIARAEKDKDPYVVALAANAAASRGDAALPRLLRLLSDAQKDDGSIVGATTSVMGSGGDNLAVETTSLAVLAWVRDADFVSNADRALRYLASQRDGSGRFGATQATVLALRALIAYSDVAGERSVSRRVTVRVNGEEIDTLDVPVRSLRVPSVEGGFLDALRPGVNRIELVAHDAAGGEGAIPWSVSVRYTTDLPPSSPGCALRIGTRLDRDHVDEGELVTASVRVANRTAAAVPTPLVRVGIPAGLEPVTKSLDRLVDEKTIASYEVRPREVTLYFRDLSANSDTTLPIDLIAAIPGRFEGPASQAYLYYTDDLRVWTKPLRVTVVAR